MSTRRTVRRVRSTYEFIKAHHAQDSVQALCRVLGAAASGYDAWSRSRFPIALTRMPDSFA